MSWLKKGPPSWAKDSVPSLNGWRNPKTGELVDSRSKITQEELDEYLGNKPKSKPSIVIPTEAPTEAPIVEIVEPVVESVSVEQDKSEEVSKPNVQVSRRGRKVSGNK
jgi:hypothetical protein